MEYTDLTVCVRPTGSADLVPGEPPAAPEGVPGGAARTPADGLMHCAAFNC